MNSPVLLLSWIMLSEVMIGLFPVILIPSQLQPLNPLFPLLTAVLFETVALSPLITIPALPLLVALFPEIVLLTPVALIPYPSF